MANGLEHYAARGAYRTASMALLAIMYLPPVLAVRLGLPASPTMLIGFPAFILLAMVTHKRLRRAGLSGNWVVLMLVHITLGPVWTGLPPLTIDLGALVFLLPVIMGWSIPDGYIPPAAREAQCG